MERLEKVLADTGGIIASLDPTDDNHLNVVEVILSSEVIIPATILPEVDYLYHFEQLVLQSDYLSPP